ncbi:MAG: epoxyqueuosine reductase QueH [Bacteroides sp.]|nr:epoxyqueuosine reductase QueH [Bacteroides sp.]
MNQVNYQKELEKILDGLSGAGSNDAGILPGTGLPPANPFPPRLLLHSCCAPCSSYCLEYLCTYFAITVFYFNPNISEEAEYCHRVAEQKRLIAAYNEKGMGYPIRIVEGDYEPSRFGEIARGYEDCPEGGARCARCFDLRLRETAGRAAAEGFDFFGTTLTISPLKNAWEINRIGTGLAEEYGVAWLPSDFKKKDGYKRSIELSAEYGLYRQDYCGCAFSKAERDRRENGRENRRET